MELSPRLLKITQLVPKGARLADIGTDHAYIPVYCLLEGIIESALAMDVNIGPLKRADANIEKFGFKGRIETRLSDGLSNLKPDEADVIVIAGMGGLLIRDILEKGKDVIGQDTLLILQPMIAPAELRIYLYSNGFDVIDEYVVSEENKFYNIFVVKKGHFKPSFEHIYIGKNLIKNSPETIRAYLEYKIRVCSGIVNGMEKSENPDYDQIGHTRAELKIYETARKELK